MPDTPTVYPLGRWTKVHNPNCDGDHCKLPTGEVRVLPMGKNPNHGNLILCKACFEHELAYRRLRNRNLAHDCQFQLPTWESLATYKTE